MSCCTKDNTKEKVKDEKKNGCNSEQTENVKSTSGESPAEDCNGESCKIPHGDDSEQKTNEGCCD